MRVSVNNSFRKYKQNVCRLPCDPDVIILDTTDEAKRVEQQFRNIGMDAPEFQRRVGIQSQHWTNWRHRGIPKNKLVRVSEVIRKPVDWILTGREWSDPAPEYHRVKQRSLGSLAALISVLVDMRNQLDRAIKEIEIERAQE